MAKPWGRYEIGHTRHPKFLALSSNAYALWWEAKNYCDEHHTDGLFRRETLRTFRFNGSKSVELLTRSCGLKPNGASYAPLWEVLDIGGVSYFRMHDYLDHNDCHDEVKERMDDAADRAELRRLQARERKRAERDRRRQEITSLKTEDVTLGHAVSRSGHADVTHQTQTEAQTETPTPTPQEHERPRVGGAEAFMDTFREGWKRLYGYECSLILNSLQVMQLEQQIAKCGDQLRPALAAYFSTDDAYIRRAKHPLPLFLREPLKYLAKAPVVSAGTTPADIEKLAEIVRQQARR